MSVTNFHSSQNQAKMKVLIVGDMPRVRQDLRQLLELTGLFEILTEAGDPQEALHQATLVATDAVLVDQQMPGQDAYEAIHLIKSHFPSRRVVLLGAYSTNEEREHAYTAGADGFVMKGERYEALVNALLGTDYPPIFFNSKEGE